MVTGYTGRVSLLLAVGWLFTQLGRQLLPPLLPTIIDELRITPFLAGLALTFTWAVYALTQYPGGRLSDRLSRKTVVAAGLVLTVAGFATLSVTTAYWILLAGLGLVGVGAAMYFISMRSLLSDLFTERRGEAFGFNQAAGNAGNVVAAGLATLVLAVAVWQLAFLPVVVVLVVVLAFVHRWLREPYVLEYVSLDIQQTGLRLLKSTEIRLLIVTYSVVVFTIQAVTSFLPTFLQFERGLSPALANGGFALIFVVGTVTKPLAGYVSDRFDRAAIGTATLLLGTVGLVGMLVFDALVLLGASMVAFAAGILTYPTVVQAYLMDTFTDGDRGGDFGAVKMVYTGFASLGPGYVGFVADRASFSVAFSSLFLILFVGIACMVWIHWRVR